MASVYYNCRMWKVIAIVNRKTETVAVVAMAAAVTAAVAIVMRYIASHMPITALNSFAVISLYTLYYLLILQ